VPLRPEVVRLIREAQAHGRPVYLASASDHRYVRALAERIGGIAGVFGTEPGRNLAGAAKAEQLVAAFGPKGYDYIGDMPVDLQGHLLRFLQDGRIVRVGGQFSGYRYLQCALCSTEYHVVRVKCSNCDSTKGIAYHGIEGGSEALKAESCDECHTYRKIGYQEKDYDFEPLADDLASLTLDLLMNEAGYRRSSPNPLLWPEVSSDE